MAVFARSHLALRLGLAKPQYWFTTCSSASRKTAEFSTSAAIMKSSMTSRQADVWAASLRPNERAVLLAALQKHAEPIIDITAPSSSAPTTRDLVHAGVFYALPFVGFGFLDNFIMIIAGDYIDLTLGATLGISTMAAAALGNAISDVAGIGSAWYVEFVVAKLGMQPPNLDPVQMASKSARWAINIGRAVGVTVGCILGMIPLLVLPTAEDKEKDQNKGNV